jgi:hypothetical protein
MAMKETIYDENVWRTRNCNARTTLPLVATRVPYNRNKKNRRPRKIRDANYIFLRKRRSRYFTIYDHWNYEKKTHNYEKKSEFLMNTEFLRILMVLVDGEYDDDNQKDAFIDVTTSLDTFHAPQTFPYHVSPIPLATIQGHYNTVHLLPPANGPPTLPGLARHLTNGIVYGGCWHPLNHDGSWCRPAASFVLNWHDNLHEFDKLSDARNHFLDEWKLTVPCSRMLCTHLPNFVKSS